MEQEEAAMKNIHTRPVSDVAETEEESPCLGRREHLVRDFVCTSNCPGRKLTKDQNTAQFLPTTGAVI